MDGVIGGEFDDFLHVPARLSIMALLAPADWATFAFLRDTIGTSDSALSKQITALADAGYVSVRKDRAPARGEGARQPTRQTLVRMTPQGRQAFRRHAAALERIVAAANQETAP